MRFRVLIVPVLVLVAIGVYATVPPAPNWEHVEASVAPVARDNLVIPPTAKEGDWRCDHCGMCCAMPREFGYRVWATGHDGEGWCIGVADLDSNMQIIKSQEHPCLQRGADESWDDEQVLIPCVVERGDELWMYYAGHSGGHFPGKTTQIGLAISRDDGLTWEKHTCPVLVNSDFERSASTPCVQRRGNGWVAFFTSVGMPGDMRPHQRYAISSDGISWEQPADNVALDLTPERSATRLCPWQDGNRWLATYSSVSDGVPYRIRLAESRDGLRFTDLGELLAPDGSGFDSRQCEYGWFLPESGVMFYSGDGFGNSGTGAVHLNKLETFHALTTGRVGSAVRVVGSGE